MNWKTRGEHWESKTIAAAASKKLRENRGNVRGGGFSVEVVYNLSKELEKYSVYDGHPAQPSTRYISNIHANHYNNINVPRSSRTLVLCAYEQYSVYSRMSHNQQ